MQYLIKDLSRLTGISGARIRKWQERFGIFSPQQGDNGYWYYDSDDYLLLRSIGKRLSEGEKLSHIIQLGSTKLLQSPDEDKFNAENWELIKIIQKNSLHTLRRTFEAQFQKSGMKSFLKDYLRQKIIMVGEAWSLGHLSVAEEHSFTRFIFSFLSEKIADLQTDDTPRWLVATFPDDPHELGAFMHYCLLLHKKIPAKYCGSLPEKYLIKEIASPNYQVVSLSLVVPQEPQKILELKQTIMKHLHVRKVIFGGYGYTKVSQQTDL